jgi:hypothetical protein
MRASLAAFETDTSYYATVARLFKTLRSARDSFPSDPEVWFALGDAYFHWLRPRLSIPEDTIRAALTGRSRRFVHTGVHPCDRASVTRWAERGTQVRGSIPAPADG